MGGTKFPLQKYNGGSTTPTVGAAKSMTAPPPPTETGFILLEDELDLELEDEADPETKEAIEHARKILIDRNEDLVEESKIPATKPETDARQSKCWILRLKSELAGSSDLMKALRPIDPAKKLQRIRVVRKITKINLKEAKLVVDALNDRIPTTSKDGLETALMVAKQRDDLAKGLEEAQTELHHHREEIKEELCEEIKEELQNRLQDRLSKFNKLRKNLKAAYHKVATQEDEILKLKGDIHLAESAFDDEVENVQKATTQIENLQDDLNDFENRGSEFIEAWKVMTYHYKEHMPKNRVFSGLLHMMGQMLGADVNEW